MTTYNDQNTSRYDRNEDDRDRRDSDRKRHFARSVALGASISAIMFGGIFAATEVAHHNSAKHPTVSHTVNATLQTPAATPATGGSSSSSGAQVETGAAVTALQQDLGQLNYYEGPINGVYGSATKAAVEDFQRANGLAVDGIAGPQTMALIQKQLITGDSQMGGSGLPSKQTGSNTGGSSNTGGGAINGGSTTSGGSSTHGGSSANGGSTTNGGSTNGGGSSTHGGSTNNGGSSSTGGSGVGA